MAGAIVEQAGAIVFRVQRGSAEVLIVRAKKQPDDWIFPKGHIERDERSEDAALREAREEAGVVGRILRPVCPPLEFASGSERVRVQYYLIVATGEGRSEENRDRRWLAPDAALQTITHKDARELLRDILPDILELAALTRSADERRQVSETAFRELLLAEYQHTAESLLRNEEDGEKRVTFFMTLAGAVGTALTLIRDGQADVGPATVHPLIVFTLAIVAAIGYLTFVRVVTRNLASDSFKRSLNRIRRYFVPGPEDPRGAFLAFDPFKLDVRPRPSWRSIGRGGWLETVVLVESVIVGGLTAMLVPTAAWWQDGIIAAITAFVSWVFLLRDAARRYADKRQFKPC